MAGFFAGLNQLNPIRQDHPLAKSLSALLCAGPSGFVDLCQRQSVGTYFMTAGGTPEFFNSLNAVEFTNNTTYPSYYTCPSSTAINTSPLKKSLPKTILAIVSPRNTNGGFIYCSDIAQGIGNRYGYSLSVTPTTNTLNLSFYDGGAAAAGTRRTAIGNIPLDTSFYAENKFYVVTAVIAGPTNMVIETNAIRNNLTYSGTGSGIAFTSTQAAKIGWTGNASLAEALPCRIRAIGIWDGDLRYALRDIYREAADDFPTLLNRTKAKSFYFLKAVSFTASGTIITGAATCSGSATFTKPVYTGTSTVTIAATTCSASGTFTKPVYSATSSVTIAAATCSATGTFVAPVYTGTSVLTVGAATASGAATFVAPVYTASAAVTVGALVANVAGSVVSPTFTGTAAVSVGAAVASGTALFGSNKFVCGRVSLSKTITGRVSMTKRYTSKTRLVTC